MLPSVFIRTHSRQWSDSWKRVSRHYWQRTTFEVARCQYSRILIHRQTSIMNLRRSSILPWIHTRWRCSRRRTSEDRSNVWVHLHTKSHLRQLSWHSCCSWTPMGQKYAHTASWSTGQFGDGLLNVHKNIGKNGDDPIFTYCLDALKLTKYHCIRSGLQSSYQRPSVTKLENVRTSAKSTIS